MSNRKFTDGSRWVLVSGWLGLLVYGCSTPADDNDDGRLGTGGGTSGSAGSGFSGAFSGSAGATSGSAGVGVGGTPATGGTAGTPAGGTPATGGAAGSSTGGTVAGTGAEAGSTATGGTAGTPAAGSGPGGAGAGGSGSVNVDPACKGISSNMACTPEAQMCPNLACGLGDTGRRDCNCATNWTCTSCNYSASPIATKPAGADTPCVGVTEMAACAMPNDPASVCASTAVAGEYCICALNPRAPADPPEWDCDDPPSVWP